MRAERSALLTLTTGFRDGRGKRRLRVGLIGLGSIAQSAVDLVERDERSPIDFVGALVRDAHGKRGVATPVVDNLAALLELRPDVIAEAAGHGALRQHGPACLIASVPLLVLSTGALADAEFEEQMREAALRGEAPLIIASGGVGGLDILASAANGGLSLVRHVITKRPSSFGVTAAVRTELFRGPAREAAQRFPQNANVAATVAFAGVGLDQSETVVVADPDATANRQDLVVEGAFGRFQLELENKPSPTNPKSAAVVAMSMKHALEKLAVSLVIG